MVYVMLTDILEESSKVIFEGHDAGRILADAFEREENENGILLEGIISKKETVDSDSYECHGRESLILSLKTGMSNRLSKGSQYRNDQWLKVLWRKSRGFAKALFVCAGKSGIILKSTFITDICDRFPG